MFRLSLFLNLGFQFGIDLFKIVNASLSLSKLDFKLCNMGLSLFYFVVNIVVSFAYIDGAI